MILRSEVATLKRIASHSVQADVGLLLRYWNGEDCEPGVDLQEVWLRVQRADWELTKRMIPMVTVGFLAELARKLAASFIRKVDAVATEREWASFPAVVMDAVTAWGSWAILCFVTITGMPIPQTVHIGRVRFYAR